MNAHLNDGQIRAALDGELRAGETRHLAGCPECRARLEQIQARNRLVNAKLSSLASENEKVPPARLALARFRHQTVQKEEKPMIQKIFRSRFARAATAAILLLAAVVAIPTTRAWAAELLSLFRVQQAEADFDPLPFDAAAARAVGQVAASLRRSGRKPAARSFDAMIAPTALSSGLPLYTANPGDFAGIEGLVLRPVEVPDPRS